jgi:hypothetical protein
MHLKMAFLSGVQEKDIFTEKAQKTLGLLLNIPDPHGTGGTTDATPGITQGTFSMPKTERLF